MKIAKAQFEQLSDIISRLEGLEMNFNARSSIYNRLNDADVLSSVITIHDTLEDLLLQFGITKKVKGEKYRKWNMKKEVVV